MVCEYQAEPEGKPHVPVDYDKITKGNMISSLSLEDAKAVQDQKWLDIENSKVIAPDGRPYFSFIENCLMHLFCCFSPCS